MSGGLFDNDLPITERTFGRKVEGLRWHEGKLQVLYSEKYEQKAGARFLGGGERERWEDVEGDAPSPEAGLLDLVYRIRVAAGDPEGKLMQDELVERVRKAITGE